jgi:hypothetical protein
MVGKMLAQIQTILRDTSRRPGWYRPALALAGAAVLTAGVVLAVRAERQAKGAPTPGVPGPAASAPSPVPSPAPTQAPSPAPSPAPNRPPKRLLDELRKHVDNGRLDEQVYHQMADAGEADGLVALDDEQVYASIRRAAAARGITLTDDTLVQLRPVVYAELKRLVLAVAPEQARAVQDFESFGVVQVHFSSPQALLEVLKRPEVSGVRAIEEYKRPQ